jgi:hypothetical protein
MNCIADNRWALDRIESKARDGRNAARENQVINPRGVLAEIPKKVGWFCRFR